jgi:hypothetical protein
MAPKDFDSWKKQVDAILVRLCGMSSDDLPDYGYADAFENGCSAKVTAKRALRAAKEF